MERFCKKCGKPLTENGTCDCKKSSTFVGGLKSFVQKVMYRMGIGGRTMEDTFDMFERDQKVIPDNVSSNSGEIPIKQYKIAKLRSRILGKFAEGRLMVTNQRVIFRGAGISYQGKQLLQYEFDINEIGGIEIKKSYRVSILNLFLASIVTSLTLLPTVQLFSFFKEHSSLLTTISCIPLTIVLLGLFFIIKKKFWLKLISTCIASGMAIALTSSSNKLESLILGDSLLESVSLLETATFIIWIFNMILVCLVPDLRLCIKSKSFGEGIMIRRKIWGIFFNHPNEYTDFSEVLPWTDTDKAIEELGAIINAVQTSGDYAIENWKED